MITRVAHAKINLALHVTGQRKDGYHLLDTIVGFTEFGDRISVQSSPKGQSEHSLEISGPFGNALSQTSDNLVLEAANKYSEIIVAHGEQFFPVHIQLEKNMPIASGIGGGSSDAAATLLALQTLWESRVNPITIASALGADVAMCLHAKPLRAQGIGDEIGLLAGVKPMHIVLSNPNVEVFTPQIFETLESKNNLAINNTTDLKVLRNDLQSPAIKIAPVISDVLDQINKQNPILSRMSGSGATCFGIFKTADAANNAKTNIASQHPEWWTIATTTLPS